MLSTLDDPDEFGKDFSLSTISLGYKFGIDIGYMLTRRLHCYAGASYKAIIPPLFSFQTSGRYDGDDLADSGPDDSNNEDNPYTGWNPDGEEFWGENYSKFGYSSWYQGGLNLSFTLSWSIRYSKYNLWGGFDDKKKY